MIIKISRILTTRRGNSAKPIVLKETENSCIVCSSHAHANNGYLCLKRNGKRQLAHRIIYEAFNGSIPEGFFTCHHCDNRGCLNPNHLFAGTHTDNMKDMTQKGRALKARGEKQGNAKLNDKKGNYIFYTHK